MNEQEQDTTANEGRDAVAKRIHDMLIGSGSWEDIAPASRAKTVFLDIADIALAAIDATEPTDAEIEAAAEAMWNHHEDYADARKWRTRHTPRQQWRDVRSHPVGEFFRGDARAAIIAAAEVRKASQP
jgi:hypothetical protein